MNANEARINDLSNWSIILTSLVFLVDDKANRCFGNQRFGKLWQAESARTGIRK